MSRTRIASHLRRIFVGALVAFSVAVSGPNEAEAYSHHELSCAVLAQRDFAHGHSPEASHQHSAHSPDCRDLPAGHDHGPDTKADHCHLGHCHGAQSGWVGAVKLVSFLSLPARGRGFVAGQSSVYLSPHLRLPFQPPRNS